MSTKTDTVTWGSGWHWPVPDLMIGNVRAPAVVSQEYRGAGDRKPHLGVDVMFRAPAGLQPVTRFYAPLGTPILSAKDGKVWSVQRTARGFAVVIDHGKPFATFYTHLESVTPGLTKGTPVTAGMQIGKMGADPTDPGKVRHLHFAVWYQGSGDNNSVDPESAMRSWARGQWTVV